MKELVHELALGLRAEVLPLLGSRFGRAHMSGTSNRGGDVTFAIDEVAESHLERFVEERAPDHAFYSEDRGLVQPATRPKGLLVVDPIDGTRPALAGLEPACISVALAPFSPEATMGDVQAGCVVEIKTGCVFYAERGSGTEVHGADGAPIDVRLSSNTDITKLFWTFGFRGRPAKPLVEVLGGLIDASSVGGGVFDLGSASFDMTRIITGQLDAYIDIGSHMIDQIPDLADAFIRVGGGAILNNSPYDLAAAALCLTEAGVIVTDGAGKPLSDRPLLGSGHEFQMSCVACANEKLHELLLHELHRGLASFKKKLSREA